MGMSSALYNIYITRVRKYLVLTIWSRHKFVIGRIGSDLTLNVCIYICYMS